DVGGQHDRDDDSDQLGYGKRDLGAEDLIADQRLEQHDHATGRDGPSTGTPIGGERRAEQQYDQSRYHDIYERRKVDRLVYAFNQKQHRQPSRQHDYSEAEL